MPDWKSFHDKLDLGDGGVIAGPTREARTFQTWFLKQRRPITQGQSSSKLPSHPAERRCQSCATQLDCSSRDNYNCAADVGTSADSKLLEGCCKLDTYSTSTGRRLLSNSTASAEGGRNTAGTLMGDYGCACNCTYVSQACCGAPDGLVFEPLALKKGGLAPSNSTTCCNSATGLFQQRLALGNSTIC